MSGGRLLGRAGIVAMATGAIGTAACASAFSSFGGRAEGARLERVRASPQWGDGRFVNRLPPRNPKMTEALKSWWGSDAVTSPEQEVPVEADVRERLATTPPDGLRVTWMGHSSLLVELDGTRVLTDPVWGRRASPVGWAGPARFHAPPLALDELPPLDAVVISHDHYDHLDEGSIRALATREGLRFFAPLGVGAHLEAWGVAPARIVELDWWESARAGTLELTAAPARHFSGRNPAARDRTLWASWAFVGPHRRVFFSGDTGMHDDFKEIGERLGPFDVTLMESGAYNQAWADVHMGPEQAVQAHLDVRGGRMIPIHWGTFNLSVHGWTEPAERVLVAARAAGVDVAIPRPGGSVGLERPAVVERWWPDVPWRTAEQAPVRSSGLGAKVATAEVREGGVVPPAEPATALP